MISLGWRKTKNGAPFGVPVSNYNTVFRGKFKKVDSREKSMATS